MNKKLLFGIMSLAALAACTNDDFDSKGVVAEQTSPIQFEVINNNATMRASMNGNSIVWSASDGDLFTLYHGADLGAVTGYQNATYTAVEGNPATLTTPSMILPGGAIMVWPVDTTFNIGSDGNLSLSIPEVQENIENYIPYVSDLINIADYDGTAAYNTAGYNRKYPIYMRPMASQLTLKPDYVGLDALTALTTGDDAIAAITLNSVQLVTAANGGTMFTTRIPVAFQEAAGSSKWNLVDNNAFARVTTLNVDGIEEDGQTDKLTTTCINGTESCKFLILPQATIGANAVNEPQAVNNPQGVEDAAVVFNTYYGKVVVAGEDAGGSYDEDEIEDAWYRITSAQVAEGEKLTDLQAGETCEAGTGDFAGKYKTYANIAMGMRQTINAFSRNTSTSQTSPAYGEPTGAAGTRYVKVLLKYLDMSDLHIKSDQQLYDVVRVWDALDLATVTVYLDGDANNEFAISQKTIAKINEINAAKAASQKAFSVKPCTIEGHEACNTIVITGAASNANIQDIAFIVTNEEHQAVVELANETTAWNWAGTVKVGTGVSKIVNTGIMANGTGATLKTANAGGEQIFDVPFENAQGATWNITGGVLYVQFDVTNYGTVNISSGAEYRQSGGQNAFINEATALPTRFGGNDALIGVVNNSGVFATVNNGVINNYGLIEHLTDDAKTYITKNQTDDAQFDTAFGAENKMGRINLPYSNKDEDNVSITAALAEGFVSVTIDGEVSGTLNTDAVGDKVNYVIVKSGITSIAALPEQINYLEINESGTEIVWAVEAATQYTGLMVLSNVNIKLNTNISAAVTYLDEDATMYVGGTFNNNGTNWNGYYGDTAGNVATNYVTYGPNNN